MPKKPVNHPPAPVSEGATGPAVVQDPCEELKQKYGLNVNTYSNMDVEWDLSVRVFDAAGEVVASDRSQGKETMEAAVRGSIRAAKMQTPPFFYRLVHELVILNPRIWPALSGAASAEPAPKCTVEQILKMKDAGLTDEQVRAACGTTG